MNRSLMLEDVNRLRRSFREDRHVRPYCEGLVSRPRGFASEGVTAIVQQVFRPRYSGMSEVVRRGAMVQEQREHVEGLLLTLVRHLENAIEQLK